MSDPLSARRWVELLDAKDSLAFLDQDSEPVCKITRGEDGHTIFTFRTLIVDHAPDGKFLISARSPDKWESDKLNLIRTRRAAASSFGGDSSFAAAKKWVEDNFPQYATRPS